MKKTAGKRLLQLLLRLYGPKQTGRPVTVPVMLLAIQVNAIVSPGET